MKNVRYSLIAFFFSACSLLAFAAPPAVKVGDLAPALQTGKWVQGEPVSSFEKGKTYIVEFWATWCGPCRETIPHINEIHNKFKGKGLVVIGQDCWENDDSLVVPFIKKMGKKMTYRVALDDTRDDKERKEGKMAQNWMKAAGQNGIPTAFIVNKQGVLAWVGYAQELNDELVASILEDRFDLKQSAADFLKRVDANAIQSRIYAAMGKEDWTAVSSAMAEFELVAKKDDIFWQKMSILQARRDYAGAISLADAMFPKDAIGKRSPEASNCYNMIAWAMATDASVGSDDLDKAEKLADISLAFTESQDSEGMAQRLDTKARILFRLNKREEALKLQERAVKIASSLLKSELEKALKSYKRGELPKAQ